MTAVIRSVQVGDISISIAETGVGGRPLLMQHGFMGAKEDFGDWWDQLAERGWHVIAPDLRGHGATDHPQGRSSYSLRLLKSDLLGLVDVLGWTRFTLLGHSLGGILAQAIALDHPERLDALVLMDTIPGAASMGGGGWRFALLKAVVRIRGIQAIAGFVKKPPPGSPESVIRLYAERPGYVEWTQQKIRNTSSDLATTMMSELGKLPDRTDELRSLSLPTLVMAGEHDLPGFVDGSRRMAEAIEGARFVLLDGAGHSPQLETPDAWWQALTTFLDALPDPARPQAEDLT